MTPPLIRLGIHLDIAIAAGGEEALDAGAHHGHAQRLIALQRQNFEELGALSGCSAGSNRMLTTGLPSNF